MSIESFCAHIITVEENVGVADGAGQIPQTWRPLYTDVMARVRPLSARERAQWQGMPVIATHIVYVPDTMLAITEKHRIVYGRRTFNIVGVRNVDELDRYYIVECEEIK